jgi:hypothetical protein
VPRPSRPSSEVRRHRGSAPRSTAAPRFPLGVTVVLHRSLVFARCVADTDEEGRVESRFRGVAAPRARGWTAAVAGGRTDRGGTGDDAAASAPATGALPAAAPAAGPAWDDGVASASDDRLDSSA